MHNKAHYYTTGEKGIDDSDEETIPITQYVNSKRLFLFATIHLTASFKNMVYA